MGRAALAGISQGHGVPAFSDRHGQPHELITTSKFNGRKKEVQVLFIEGCNYEVRIVFEGCSPHQVDEILAGVRVVG